ncbi:MAG: PAC2 family protein [Halobacteriales archaeon]|nr:PAC2 family protein [Halobacteriales archaeon]
MSSSRPDQRADFQISQDVAPSDTLIAGFSHFGLAGLTAVDYLVDHLELEETGHVTTSDLPSITPFENGVPRHHSRLFSRADIDVTVLVNELFIPVWAADQFSNAILRWTDENDVEEITVLSGIPIPHGPDDHRAFYVATPDYHDKRLTDVDIPPMGNGFLDGINASLIDRGMESDLRAGVFITPVHAQAPDVEAALRLLDAFRSAYDVGIDTEPLETFAAEVQQYYADLAERLDAVEDTQHPDDRMYM